MRATGAKQGVKSVPMKSVPTRRSTYWPGPIDDGDDGDDYDDDDDYEDDDDEADVVMLADEHCC